jgi:[ribosomal protein S5]-alanine N-acetyltransferase
VGSDRQHEALRHAREGELTWGNGSCGDRCNNPSPPTTLRTRPLPAYTAPQMIRTPNLDLIPATAAHFAALAQSEPALAAALGVAPAAEWLDFEAAREAMAHAGAWLAAHPEAASWWTHWFVHRADAALIGLGGFKGAPADGAVEIGYALAPGYRHRGLAAEAARGMLAFAWANPGVDRVLAHTLPAANASTAVLERLGFANQGAVIDPEDGEIWRWSLPRPA